MEDVNHLGTCCINHCLEAGHEIGLHYGTVIIFVAEEYTVLHAAAEWDQAE